jgi:tRNA pseudouridine38-40 synthase
LTRFRLTVEFDGRPFMGWQRQQHGPSVQGAIEAAAARVLGHAVTLHAAGRTDAGVHALAMTAHFDSDKAISPFRLGEALNAQLRSAPIAILACEAAPDVWHARFSCIARSYVYRISNRRAPLALAAGRAWRIGQPLNSEAMDTAAQLLIGCHDFTTFRSAHCQSASPIKSLDRLDVQQVNDQLEIHAQARSFLHHQVRSMVGCLALVGLGKWTDDDLAAALAARDRSRLGLNAPPDGLYFVRADY